MSLYDEVQVVEIVDEYQTVCVPSSYTDNDQRVQFIQDVTTNKMCTRTLTVGCKHQFEAEEGSTGSTQPF